jgi:hypothetical protein
LNGSQCSAQCARGIVTGRKAIYVLEGECVGICGLPDEQSLPLIKELADMVTRLELC